MPLTVINATVNIQTFCNMTNDNEKGYKWIHKQIIRTIYMIWYDNGNHVGLQLIHLTDNKLQLSDRLIANCYNVIYKP